MLTNQNQLAQRPTIDKLLPYRGVRGNGCSIWYPCFVAYPTIPWHPLQRLRQTNHKTRNLRLSLTASRKFSTVYHDTHECGIETIPEGDSQNMIIRRIDLCVLLTATIAVLLTACGTAQQSGASEAGSTATGNTAGMNHSANATIEATAAAFSATATTSSALTTAEAVASINMGDGTATAEAMPEMNMTETATTEAMPGMQMGDNNVPYDAQFIDSMIEHHQGAIDMANQVLQQGERGELKTLAQGIITAQTSEIEQLQQWRKDWYPALAPTQGMSMDMGDMEISPDTSKPFDQRFIEAMIAHHQGAIEMARDAQQNAEHTEIKTLAENIITAQEAEIKQMQQWQQAWFGA